MIPFAIEPEYVRDWDLDKTLFAGLWYEPSLSKARISKVVKGVPPHIRVLTDLFGVDVDEGCYFVVIEPSDNLFGKFVTRYATPLLDGNIGINGKEIATHVVLIKGNYGVIILADTFKALLRETLSGKDTTDELKLIFTPRKSQS